MTQELKARLSVDGAEKVKAQLEAMARSGEEAFRKIEGAAADGTSDLAKFKVVSDAIERGMKEVRKTLQEVAQVMGTMAKSTAQAVTALQKVDTTTEKLRKTEEKLRQEQEKGGDAATAAANEKVRAANKAAAASKKEADAAKKAADAAAGGGAAGTPGEGVTGAGMGALISSYVGRIKTGAGAVGAILAKMTAGIAASTAALGALVAESATWANLQVRMAAAGGTNVQAFGRLQFAAESYGAAADEAMGALSAFSDKIAEAARGEDAKQFFDALGIKVTDANGNLRDSVELLGELADATNKLNPTLRASYLNELLGGDAEKLSDMLASGSAGMKELGDEAERLGVVITPRQRQLFAEFGKALTALRAAFRAVALEIAERFAPALAQDARTAAKWISEHRADIADLVVNGYNRLVRMLHSIRSLFVTGGGAQRKWFKDFQGNLGRAAANADVAAAAWAGFGTGVLPVVGTALVGISGALADVLALLAGGRAESFPLLNLLPKAFGKALDLVTNLLPESVKSFEGMSLAVRIMADTVDTSFLLMRAAAVNFLERVRAGAAHWNALLGAVGLPTWQSLATALGQAGTYLTELWAAIQQVVAGGNASPDFSWVNTLRDGFLSLKDQVMAAWENFRWFYDNLRSFLGLFGLDLGTTLLTVSLLKWTGMLALVAAPIQLLLGLLGAGGGMAGAFTVLGPLIAAAVGHLATFATWVATMAGGAGLAGAAATGILVVLGAGLGVLIAKFMEFIGVQRKVNDMWFEMSGAAQEYADTLKQIQDADAAYLNSDAYRRKQAGAVPSTEVQAVPAYASGGHVRGPGTGTSDSILAALSNGEFVIKASRVRELGVGFLNRLNQGGRSVMAKLPRFAEGGLVGAGALAGSASGRPVHLHLGNGDVIAARSSADDLVGRLRKAARSKPASKPIWY